MIRLLLICIVILSVIWLITEYFSKNKEKNEKIRFKGKYLVILLVILAFLGLLRFFPKLFSNILNLQSYLAPLLSFIKTFIPF